MTFAAIVLLLLLLSSRGGEAMFERGRRQMLEKYHKHLFSHKTRTDSVQRPAALIKR